jgi:hypothetical protein
LHSLAAVQAVLQRTESDALASAAAAPTPLVVAAGAGTRELRLVASRRALLEPWAAGDAVCGAVRCFEVHTVAASTAADSAGIECSEAKAHAPAAPTATASSLAKHGACTLSPAPLNWSNPASR